MLALSTGDRSKVDFRWAIAGRKSIAAEVAEFNELPVAEQPADPSTCVGRPDHELDPSAGDKSPPVPINELLPYNISVRREAAIRPMVLDLHRVLKRHRLIFGFYCRLVLVPPDGPEVHCQRYFHYNSPPPRQGDEGVDADQLFTRQHNIDDHLRRCQEIGEQEPANYFDFTWQAGQVLEASAREIERLHAAVLTRRADDWPQRAVVARAARLVRPAFLINEDWTRPSKVPLSYPGDLAQHVGNLKGLALTEGEDHGVFRELDSKDGFVSGRRNAVPNLRSPGPAVQRAKSIQPSADFRTVLWGDRTFTFSPLQAEIVKLLYAEYQKGPGLGLSETTIVEALGSDAERPRVDHMFRLKGNKTHPAWMTMIFRPSKGTLCLAEPNHQ